LMRISGARAGKRWKVGVSGADERDSMAYLSLVKLIEE